LVHVSSPKAVGSGKIRWDERRAYYGDDDYNLDDWDLTEDNPDDLFGFMDEEPAAVGSDDDDGLEFYTDDQELKKEFLRKKEEYKRLKEEAAKEAAKAAEEYAKAAEQAAQRDARDAAYDEEYKALSKRLEKLLEKGVDEILTPEELEELKEIDDQMSDLFEEHYNGIKRNPLETKEEKRARKIRGQRDWLDNTIKELSEKPDKSPEDKDMLERLEKLKKDIFEMEDQIRQEREGDE
jgi:hypothetical protein